MGIEIQAPDGLAEPLYALISEVFDLRGVFRLLRRTLVSLVRLSCGGTISRQLSDTAHWLVSEPMIVAYLAAIKRSVWKNGNVREAGHVRTEEEKASTREEAEQVVETNLPEIMSLVGLQTARQGAAKILALLQDQ